MVKIEERKLIQLSNTIVITLPNHDFVEKLGLKKGDAVIAAILDSALLIIDKNTFFNADEIKAEIDLVKEQLDSKEKIDQFAWIKTLSHKEQNRIKMAFEQTEKMADEYEKETGRHFDLSLPRWNVQPPNQHLSNEELILKHLANQRDFFESRKWMKEVMTDTALLTAKPRISDEALRKILKVLNEEQEREKAILAEDEAEKKVK